MRFYLHELPYKFLNHTTGPIRRLGQYSKNEVIPNDYIAIVGDSHAYGFGPWLYDNSWSWGQPDFATIYVRYVPDKLCVELKSLKLYIAKYRNEGAFHEAVTNKIHNDLKTILEPRYIKVRAKFNVRGGIYTDVEFEYRKGF